MDAIVRFYNSKEQLLGTYVGAKICINYQKSIINVNNCFSDDYWETYKFEKIDEDFTHRDFTVYLTPEASKSFQR